LKICLSLFDIDKPQPNEDNSLVKRFLDSGVKKVILIGLLPDVNENYVIVKRLWINTGLDKLKFLH